MKRTPIPQLAPSLFPPGPLAKRLKAPFLPGLWPLLLPGPAVPPRYERIERVKRQCPARPADIADLALQICWSPT